MVIGCDFAKLGKVKWHEYLLRFAWGCGLTLLFTLTTKWWGPVIGGLFLAFPGIFPAGVSLVEKKELERKEAAGVEAPRFARALASVNAAGASIGCVGLMVFSAILWRELTHHALGTLTVVATIGWTAVSYGAWWVRERI